MAHSVRFNAHIIIYIRDPSCNFDTVICRTIFGVPFTSANETFRIFLPSVGEGHIEKLVVIKSSIYGERIAALWSEFV